jgi:hypothetical protein
VSVKLWLALMAIAILSIAIAGWITSAVRWASSRRAAAS